MSFSISRSMMAERERLSFESNAKCHPESVEGLTVDVESSHDFLSRYPQSLDRKRGITAYPCFVTASIIAWM
mgnify:CR=1 FL=1